MQRLVLLRLEDKILYFLQKLLTDQQIVAPLQAKEKLKK
jgi:hypothetical protein